MLILTACSLAGNLGPRYRCTSIAGPMISFDDLSSSFIILGFLCALVNNYSFVELKSCSVSLRLGIYAYNIFCKTLGSMNLFFI